MKSPENYTEAYRLEAVKLVLEQGISLTAAAKRLGMPKGTLSNWVRAAKGLSTRKNAVAPGSRTVPELEAEIAKLRRDLTEARMERDVLKKATAYFARESLPGMRT